MTDEQKELVEKARESHDASRVLFDSEHYDYAAARAYYTMFYLAEAFLEGEELSSSKHSAVIANFGKHFAKPRKIPRKLHQYLLDASEWRESGDYGAPPAACAVKTAEDPTRPARALRPRAGPPPGDPD